MSRLAPPTVEPVDIPDRPKLSVSRKRAIWERAGGICWLCTKPVPVDGPDVQYDHRNQRAISGDDSDDNLFPMHTEPCHRLKTKADATLRAKVYRVKKKHETRLEDVPGRGQLRGRGFDSPRRRFFEGEG